MAYTSSSTEEISRTSSTDLVESEEIHSDSFADSSVDFLHRPAGMLLTNVSVVAVEHSVTNTGRGRRFGALSDVSFNVELVSSSSESSCSDLALPSKDAGTRSYVSPTTQRSTNGHRGERSSQTGESPVTRLIQSAPDIAPGAEPYKEHDGCSGSSRQIERDQDNCKVFGRHSLDNCLERDRHGLGDTEPFKENITNVFQSCKPKLRKDPKTPLNICSFRKRTRSVRLDLKTCVPSACSKPHSQNRATTNRLSPPRRDSKDTNSQVDRFGQEHVILPRPKMTEGENSENKSSELEHNRWTFERASTGPRTEESWMKSLVSKLIQCISGDGPTGERWGKLWNSGQRT